MEKSDRNFHLSHRSLSRLIKYTDTNEHFIELNKIYKNIKVNDTEYKINIAFALGKAYEDIKNFDKSFVFYKEAYSLYSK